MNMLIFLSSIFLVFLMLVEKLYFLFLENTFLDTLMGKIEYLSLIIFTILICYTFWKNISLNNNQESKKISPVKLFFNNFLQLPITTKLLLSMIILVIGLSFYVNISKQSLDGDGVSLYDARAKFLMAGYKFSNMNKLNIYDSQDPFYYLLYPPYTSIMHFLWYQGSFPFPVSVIYSFYLILLASGLFLLIRDSLGTGWSLFLVLAVIFHNVIFLTATNEHTYLPFTLYLVYGILLIARFFKNGLLWEFLCGALLVAFSQWIRFSEVVWLGVIIAYFLTIVIDFLKLKTIHHYKLPRTESPQSCLSADRFSWISSFQPLRHLFPRNLETSFRLHLPIKIGGSWRSGYKIYILLGIIFSIVSLLEYQSWTYFVKNVADTPSQNSFNYLSAPLNILKDNYLQHFVNVIQFLFLAWGSNFIIFIISLFSQVRAKVNKKYNLNILFIKLVIILVILMYAIGLYGASFGGDWWKDINVSLARSSSFLIPLSYFLIFIHLKGYLQKYPWKSFLKISIKAFFSI